MKNVLPLSLIMLSLVTISACSTQDNSNLTDNGGQNEAANIETEDIQTETTPLENEDVMNQDVATQTEDTTTQTETSDSFTLEPIHGVPANTTIEMNSWPKEITLVSNEQNTTRTIKIEERDECMKKHPFNFETYSGNFATKGGETLNRLSYPEQGDGSLFVVDEYGFNLDNGHCLTFSYTAVIANALSSTGEYDEAVYTNELDKAAEIMSTLTVPSK